MAAEPGATLQGEQPWAERDLPGPFSDRAVLLTSFFGGPAAGAILAGMNARRLGMGRRGLAVVAVACAVAFLVSGAFMLAWSGDELRAAVDAIGSGEGAGLGGGRRTARAVTRGAGLLMATVLIRLQRSASRRRHHRQDDVETPNGLAWGIGAIVLAMPLNLAYAVLVVGLVALGAA